MIRKAFSTRDLREESTIKLREVNAGGHCLTMLDSGLFLLFKTSSELEYFSTKEQDYFMIHEGRHYIEKLARREEGQPLRGSSAFLFPFVQASLTPSNKKAGYFVPGFS